MKDTDYGGAGGRTGGQYETVRVEGNSLHELFLDELGDMYNAEKQLTKALPKLSKFAQSNELREAFESHLRETETHVRRLERVAEVLGQTLDEKKCAGMHGIISEGEKMAKKNKGTPSLNAALIAAAQKAEHYEIATYGTLCAWAGELGQNDAADLLKETLEEEKTADQKLTSLAQTFANSSARQNA